MWSSKKSPRDRGIRPRTLYFSLCILLLFIAASCKGGSAAQDIGPQKNSGSPEQTVKSLLPIPGEVQGWAPSGKPESFSGERLFDHIDGGADIYFEYGFVTVVTQQYKKDDKAVSIEIYRMDDPAAAFGIYSYNRHPSLSRVEVGSGATIHPNGLFFWQDKYYVDIRQTGSAPVLPDEFTALAKAVSKKIGVTAEPPPIIGRLPKENLIPRTEVFARGKLAINNLVYISEEDLFGLAKGEASAIGRYKITEPEFSIVVAQYASPEACDKAFKRLRDHFMGAGSTKESEFVIEARPKKYFAVRKMGNTLVVVANADGQKNAVEMLDKAGTL